MDRGLSIAWYDLAQSGRERYLEWLHHAYIPAMLEKPGVLWAAHYKTEKSIAPMAHLRQVKDAAIPTGKSYIFMLGARDAHALAALTPYKLEPSAKEKEMFALRVGERRNIFTEEARCDGPEAKRREGEYQSAPCIQLGSFNSGSYLDEDELLSWYAHLRLPAMSRTPGAIGMRKLASVSGWAKHGVMYEFVSLEEREKNFRVYEARDTKEAAWTHEVVAKLMHAPGSPAVAQRIWPAPPRP